VVPDVREQWQLIESARMQMHMRVSARVDNEIRLIDGYANRPSLTHPLTMLEPHQRFLDDAKQRMERGLTRIVDDASLTVEKLHASLTALSPQSTLNRGYAVVQGDDGRVVDDARDVRIGDELTLTLKHGVVVSHATAIGDQRQQGKAK
jgi:exodeoxyribonuclease VII large subunit